MLIIKKRQSISHHESTATDKHEVILPRGFPGGLHAGFDRSVRFSLQLQLGCLRKQFLFIERARDACSYKIILRVLGQQRQDAADLFVIHSTENKMQVRVSEAL